MRHKMKRTRSKLHRIGTFQNIPKLDISKISLSCFDDKRFILDVGDGINSLDYFHKDVKSQSEM